LELLHTNTSEIHFCNVTMTYDIQNSSRKFNGLNLDNMKQAGGNAMLIRRNKTAGLQELTEKLLP